jgi:cystathionine beta-lyase
MGIPARGHDRHRPGVTASRDYPKTVAPVLQRGSTVLLPTAADLYRDDIATYGLEGLSSHIELGAALMDLEHGCTTVLYPSGLSAITCALMAVVKAGEQILCVDSVYKPTRRFCDEVLGSFGVTTTYYDPALSPEDILAQASGQTRVIVLESPGSLTFEFQDVPKIARLARDAGILTLIDNTWAAGVLFKPLDHQVDISVQALTKYVGGHSDLFMGSAVVSDPELGKRLVRSHKALGLGVSPDDAWMMLRGLRTLDVRLARHGETALDLARWLATQDSVHRVLHPALPDCPGHALWKQQFSGACGLFAIEMAPGSDQAVAAFLDALKVFGLGFSWGGFESLAINCDPQLKARVFPASTSGPLIRLHAGLEPFETLQQDLVRALDAYDRARMPA